MAKYETLLQEYVVSDNRDAKRFRALSENDKMNMSKELVESLYKSTTEKALSLHYDDIERTKGDFTKIDDYTTLFESLNLLKGLQSGMTEKIESLDVVLDAHNNLINQKANFEQGYRVDNMGVILLYNNIAMAVVASTSFLIATTIDYVKDPVGNYSSHYRNNATKGHGYSTIMIDALAKFNKLVVNGELSRFFEFSFSKRALTGIALGTGAGVAVAIGLSFAIVPIIREIVYQFYSMRVSSADYLRLQANFLEMNKSRLSGIKNMKETSRKQEKIMNVMVKLADKIDVDQKTSSKKAENELKKENSKINIDSPSLPKNNDVYDSLL